MKPKQATQKQRGVFVKKLLLIIAAIVLLFCVVSIIASAVIYRVLFPRQTGIPKFHYSYEELSVLSDASVHVSVPRFGFRFRSGKNELQGWRYDAESPKGLILVVNGIGSGADEHLAEILFFVENNWSVVTWDATGVGASEGRGIIGLQQIRSDLEAFFAYFGSDSSCVDANNLPVVIYSHSAGAYAAALCLAANDNIRGAVCISGFDRPVELMYHHAKTRIGLLADIEKPFLDLENYFLFGSGANDSARDALRGSPVPVLVVNGSSDDLVPWEFSLARDPDSYQNPNIRCLEISSAYQNEHSAPWLSSSAAEYLYFNMNDPNAPIDKALASELNLDFMHSILDFYAEAVS